MMGRRRPRRYQAGGMTQKQRNEEIDRFYTEQATARALEEERKRLLNSGRPKSPPPSNGVDVDMLNRIYIQRMMQEERQRDMQRRAKEAEMDRKMQEAAAKPPQQRGYRMGGMARPMPTQRQGYRMGGMAKPTMTQAQRARLIQALRNRRGR